MKAYHACFMSGEEAIEHIVAATNCDGLAAWVAFRDAAADGRLGVVRLDANLEPVRMPVGRWKQAKLAGDTWIMTDAGRYEVLRTEVEQIWPQASAGNSPTIVVAGAGRLTCEVDKLYDQHLKNYLAVHGKYPSRKDDREWAGTQGITQDRIDELRRSLLPSGVRAGGRGANRV